MPLKQLKYLGKALAIAASRDLYWRGRTRLFGPLEPELELLEQLCSRDRWFVDIGANWGAYSQEALRWSEGLHAFEPQPGLARVLKAAFRGVSNAKIHQAAVSDGSGWVQLRTPRNDIGYSTVEPANQLEGKVDLSLGTRETRVPKVALDELELPPISCIKIDVEGHELEALQGAEQLLRRDTPAVLVEVEERHRAGSVEAVVSYLRGLGYTPTVFVDSKIQAWGKASEQRNLLFLHERHAALLPVEMSS